MFDLETASGRHRARKAGMDVPRRQPGTRPGDPWTRFVRLFIARSDCWEWQGAKDPKGYGRFHFGGGGRACMAHRFAYEHSVGSIPEGKELDHLYRNTSCVNPSHLEPVTSRENTMRGENQSAANYRKTHCPKGHSYDAANTARYEGHRQCKACRREKDKQRPSGWARQRAAALLKVSGSQG